MAPRPFIARPACVTLLRLMDLVVLQQHSTMTFCSTSARALVVIRERFQVSSVQDLACRVWPLQRHASPRNCKSTWQLRRRRSYGMTFVGACGQLSHTKTDSFTTFGWISAFMAAHPKAVVAPFACESVRRTCVRGAEWLIRGLS